MRKKIAWFVTFMVAISFVFCFVGCKQSVSPDSPIENPDNEVVAELNPIGFKISLPASKNSRAYYSQDDASSYVVKLSFDGSVISTQNGTPGQTLTFTVEKEGTYTINVEAYNTEKTLIAEGVASKSISFADGYVSVVISLKPKAKDPSNPSVIDKVNIGVDIQWVLPEEKILTLENKGNSNFRRWDSGISLGNTVVLEFTSGMTLYDIFRANDVSFYLDSYEKNGKKYEFCSYYIDSNGNEYYEYSMLTEDITLTPEFRVVPKVIFNLNGGNIYGDVSDKVYFTNWVDKYHPYQPTKDGLTFVGWTLTPDGEDFITDIEEDIIVYAKYIEVQSCTLTVTTNENSYFYSYSEGNLGTSITLEFTSGMTLREIFENNNIKFWLEDCYLNDRLYEHSGYQDVNQNEYSSDSIILGDLELTAIWVRIPMITFNLNGGNVNGDNSDVIQSPNVSLPIPVKEGYVIEAWTLSPDGDDYFITPDGEPLNYDLFEEWYDRAYTDDGDITLYAKWAEPEICTLTLTTPSNFTSISTGENLGSSLILEFVQGSTLEEIFIANDVNLRSESYYDSEGYLYSPNWSYEEYNEIEGWSRTYWGEDIVLYSLELTPVFNRMPQVTFNLNGGNVDGNTSDIIMNTTYFPLYWSPIPLPVKEGYTLIGWTLTPDGNDIIEGTDSNITVYAKWADALRLFDLGDIIGDLSADGLSLNYEGEGIYTIDFVYIAENMNGWDALTNGLGAGSIAFKLRPTAGDWSTSYGMSPSVIPPVIDGDECPLSLENGNNIVVTGFEEGVTYRITVRCTEMGEVFVRVSTVE